jgi:hypothetical protein
MHHTQVANCDYLNSPLSGIVNDIYVSFAGRQLLMPFGRIWSLVVAAILDLKSL